MSVAVIGAGWAGLACAVTLAEAGIPLTLYEAGRRPGGRARSVTAHGRDLDNGQHLLLGAYDTTLGLMRQVGANPDTLLHRMPLGFADSQGFRLALPNLPPPWHLAWGFLTCRGASWRDKWQTARAMSALAQTEYHLPENLSVEDWLKTTQPDNAFARHLWRPLCLAAMNTPPERASAAVFAQVLRDSLGNPAPGATDLLLPKTGLSTLFPDPALAYLAHRSATLRLGHRVRELHVTAEGWQVDGEPHPQVVLAVAPQHLQALLPWEMTAIPTAYEPIATVYLGYPPEVRLPTPLFHLGGVGQWVVDHGELGTPGKLACVQSGAGDWCALDDTALTQQLQAELRQLPGLHALPPPLWQLVIRERRATYACTPGRTPMAQATPWPGLFIAGDHTWAEYPATLEGACRSGVAVAQKLLNPAPATSERH